MADEHVPYPLYADELTPSDRADLLAFDCGEEPWARAATEWLLGADVWESMDKRGTKVWLYRTEKDDVCRLQLTRRDAS